MLQSQVRLGLHFRFRNNLLLLVPLIMELLRQQLSMLMTSAYTDWNFIGNPYPSAIDTNVFFTVNSGVTNTIYLWSQATPLNADCFG